MASKALAKRAPKKVAEPEDEDRATVITIGLRCKSKREEMELSRLEVANGAGIDPSSLYRFEHGKQALSVPKLARVAKVLGLGLDELVAP